MYLFKKWNMGRKYWSDFFQINFVVKVCPRKPPKTRLQVLKRPGKNSNRRSIIRFSQTPNSLYCQSTKVPYPKLFIQSRSPALVYFWDKQRVRKLTRSCFGVFVSSNKRVRTGRGCAIRAGHHRFARKWVCLWFDTRTFGKSHPSLWPSAIWARLAWFPKGKLIHSGLDQFCVGIGGTW